MAALCNFFLPGLGHLILGKPISGFLWFITLSLLYAMSVATAGLGLLITIPVHILCIVRASTIARDQYADAIARGIERSQRQR